MFDIDEGVHLFNDSDFFSAHDFFEDIWMEAEQDEKLFFQGMVQISVGCYHLICGNLKGAKSQFTKGLTKLEVYLPFYYKVNLNKLTKEIKFLLDNINKKEITRQIPKIELLTNKTLLGE